MGRAKIIKDEHGTTIIKEETGERWINKRMPLEWAFNHENGLVWMNAPMTLTIDEFEDMIEPRVSWSFEFTEEHEENLNTSAEEKDYVEYYKGK